MQYLHTCTYILLLPSNGSAGQYKNFKNFANNLHQSDDFGLDCEWNFFATSHGKNTCDGIGGTVKWLVPRTSLQSPLEGQILSVRQLFDWRMCNIQHITFFFVPAADVDSQRALLDDRFESARTIPGTRDNHSFVPLYHTDTKVSSR